MVSYSADRDNGHIGSVNGYSTLWQWSRDMVRRFIRAIQDGADYTTDYRKTGKRQAIRYIFNNLHDAQNRDVDRTTYQTTYTTKDPLSPILNPKRKRLSRASLETESFQLFYSAYPKKRDRAGAARAWDKLSPGSELVETIMSAIAAASTSEDWRRNNGQYIPYPSKWLNNRRWEDQIKQEATRGSCESEYPIDIEA
jgi:hypothetical protein